MNDKGLSLAVSINWIFTVAVALILPFVTKACDQNKNYYGFIWITCGTFAFTGIFYTKNNMKETKGLSSKQIQVLFEKNNKTKM